MPTANEEAFQKQRKKSEQKDRKEELGNYCTIFGNKSQLAQHFKIYLLFVSIITAHSELF